MADLVDASLGAVAFDKDVESSKETFLTSWSYEMSSQGRAGVKKYTKTEHKKQCRPRKPPIPNCRNLRACMLGSPDSVSDLDLCAIMRREMSISSSGESFRLGGRAIENQNQSNESLPSVSKEATEEPKEKQRTEIRCADFDGISKPPLILRRNLQKRTPAPVISSTDFDKNVIACMTSKSLRDAELGRRGSRINQSTPFIYHIQDEKPSPQGSESPMTVPSIENVKLGDVGETQELLNECTKPLKAWESRSPPIDNFIQEPDYELSPQLSPSPAPKVPTILLPSTTFELSEKKCAIKSGCQEQESMLLRSYTNLKRNAWDSKEQAFPSVSDGKQKNIIANFSKEEGSNCSRKENPSKKHASSTKGKSRRRKRNQAHALIHRHNTRPRANKPSEPSPMPEENLYSRVHRHCPITSSSVTDQHSTRPRANKQPEPSPLPVEEIYSQIRLASPAAATKHRVKRESRQNSPNPNPRSSTPGSTMTFSSLTSMATSPASNNTQINEGCLSRTFEESSDPIEREGEVFSRDEQVNGDDMQVVTTNYFRTTKVAQMETIPGQAVAGQHANAPADPVYCYQNGYVAQNPNNPVVFVLNPQGGPPTYYDIPPGATMTFRNSTQPLHPVYNPQVPCTTAGAVPQIYCTSPTGTPQTYYPPVVYSPPQMSYQPSQIYEQRFFQAPQLHPSYGLMGSQQPVNVNLPLTTENVNMHNLSNMS